jgi:hypothetical protein
LLAESINFIRTGVVSSGVAVIPSQVNLIQGLEGVLHRLLARSINFAVAPRF